MHQNRVGQIFITGIEARIFLASLLQHRFKINPTNGPATGDKCRQVVTGRNHHFVILEGRVQRRGYPGRGGDISGIDFGQSGTNGQA
ncbi:hypothetical protein D3C81_1976030 [compost metagenome]